MVRHPDNCAAHCHGRSSRAAVRGALDDDRMRPISRDRQDNPMMRLAATSSHCASDGNGFSHIAGSRRPPGLPRPIPSVANPPAMAVPLLQAGAGRWLSRETLNAIGEPSVQDPRQWPDQSGAGGSPKLTQPGVRGGAS
jgi:hypothetical protein